MTLNLAQAIKDRPSSSQVNTYYGSYRYTEASGGWINPDKNWMSNNLIKIPIIQLPDFPKLYGVSSISGVTLHTKVAPVFLYTWSVLRKEGLTKYLTSYDGAFAARHMRNNPRMPLSNHSKGAAVDFNAATNRMGIPHRDMALNRGLAQVMEELGWAWGGRWAISDGMHFEWVDQDPSCVPAHQDLRGGTIHKTAENLGQQTSTVSLGAKKLYLNGNGPLIITKSSQVGDKLYVNTKE